jgi:hypothetical protein
VEFRFLSAEYPGNKGEFNGNVIENVNFFEYLGLVLDSHLNWHAHINKAAKVKKADSTESFMAILL